MALEPSNGSSPLGRGRSPIHGQLPEDVNIVCSSGGNISEELEE